MSIVSLRPNGTLSNAVSINDVLRIEMSTYNVLGSGIAVNVAFFQTESGSFTPENTSCRIQLIDTATDDIVFEARGNLLNDDEDPSTLLLSALATKEFEIFTVEVLNEAGLNQAINASSAKNLLNTLPRNSVSVPWTSQPLESNIDDLYDIVTTADNPPDGIYMVLGENLNVFTQCLRIAQDLNIPLTVELPPDMDKNVVLMVSEQLQAKDHRVRIIWNPTLSRPNGVTSLLGKLLPRYAIGTLMGRVMLRNTNLNSNGIPPLHKLCAGYDWPFNWMGIQMRPDVKMTGEFRKKLAKARINTIFREKFRTGIRFILGDCLTQYDLKKGSPLELENSSDISMYIDNCVIELARRRLLNPQSEYVKKIYDDIIEFLDKCTDETNRLIVKSNDLGGKYYTLTVTPRKDRPNDAVDIKLGYRPEGATRAAFLGTAVYAQ